MAEIHWPRREFIPQRAYRHALRCPHCGSNWMPKYGTSRGKQTYRCGDGKHRYTPEGNRHYYSEAVKSQAVRSRARR